MTVAQPYVKIHNTVYSVQFEFHVLTYQTSTNGEGKIHPRTGHEGLEGEEKYISTLSLK